MSHVHLARHHVSDQPCTVCGYSPCSDWAARVFITKKRGEPLARAIETECSTSVPWDVCSAKAQFVRSNKKCRMRQNRFLAPFFSSPGRLLAVSFLMAARPRTGACQSHFNCAEAIQRIPVYGAGHRVTGEELDEGH